MTLLADDAKMGIQRPASPDLYHLTHPVRAGRFPYEADIHPFARLLHIIKQSQRSVDAFSFFIPGDGQDNRPVGRRVMYEVNSSSSKCRNARFHIGRTAPIHYPVFDLGSERSHRPVFFIADRHHVSMAVETKAADVTLFTPTGKQVTDTAPISPSAFEPGLIQEVMQYIQCPCVCWGHRRASYQFGS